MVRSRVRPSRCRRARILQKSRRETGSTPVVGSSRTSSSGVWMSVQARASFCFIPPERRSARRSRKGARRSSSSSSSRRGAPARDAVDRGEERDVLVHRQVAVEGEPLREVADLPREGVALPMGIEPAGPYRPRGGSEQAQDHAEGGGLARAVGPDEAEHLAAEHVEAHVAHRHERAVAAAQAIDDDEGSVGHFVPAAARTCASAGMPGLKSPSGLSSPTLTL